MTTEASEKSFLEKFIESLIDYKTRIDKKFQQTARCNQVNGTGHPIVGKLDLIEDLDRLIEFIKTHEFDLTEEFESGLDKCDKLLEIWMKDDLPNLYSHNYDNTVVANFERIVRWYWLYLDGYENGEAIEVLQVKTKEAKTKLDSLIKRVESAVEDVGNLEQRVNNIIEADKAAVALPETMETLRQTNQKIAAIKTEAESSTKLISDAKEDSVTARTYIKETQVQIEELLDKSEKALASATSAGLAHAFDKRKIELQVWGGCWIVGLVLALVAVVGAVWLRAEQLAPIMKLETNFDTFSMVFNLLVSVAFIGAPIWFAWLATKQVGYYFRLSEDYAFKASVSASYDGFRREAAKQDEALEKKVLESTLDRYDEPPLRFVDDRVSGSPIHELFASPDFREAIKTVPEFAKDVIGMAKDKIKKPTPVDVMTDVVKPDS